MTSTATIGPSKVDPPQEGFPGKAREVLAEARERFSKGAGTLQDSITEKPVRALSLAFGMGVLLGWLIKRR